LIKFKNLSINQRMAETPAELPPERKIPGA